MAAQAVGRFWQTTFADERLRGELWLDLGRATAQPGPARTAVERLQAAQPLEVSTAFFAKTQAEPGTYQDREYVGVYSPYPPRSSGAVARCGGRLLVGGWLWSLGSRVPSPLSTRRDYAPDGSTPDHAGGPLPV